MHNHCFKIVQCEQNVKVSSGFELMTFVKIGRLKVIYFFNKNLSMTQYGGVPCLPY